MRNKRKQVIAFLLALIVGVNFQTVSAWAAMAESYEEPIYGISSIDDTVSGNDIVGEIDNVHETLQEQMDSIDVTTFVPDISGKDVQASMKGNEDVINRYTVLLLDTENSFSMNSKGTTIYEVTTPLKIIKQAADRFVEQVQSANGTNYVAIVTYSSKAVIESGFSTDTASLCETIDNIKIGKTFANINDAFLKADALLSAVEDENAIKNIVLFTQGVNAAGEHQLNGQYTKEDCIWQRIDTGVPIYQYSNTTYATAQSLMEKYNLYSIGLFQSFDSVPEAGRSLLEFAIRFSKDLQNQGFLNVDSVENLEFAFGEVADDITALRQKGTFKYASGSERDYTATYYYDDTYFTKSAYVYNPSLATMSICLAMSAFGSNDTRNTADKAELGSDYSKYSQNVEQLLSEIGFEQIKTNEFYNVKPSIDSIGVIAGNKKINQSGDTYTLIAMAVRGGGYESEWGSNFTIGTDGEHQGFREAKENVLKFLKEYIESQQIEGKLKIWITGYSRAAATTNLTAAALDREAANLLGDRVTLEPKDLYAYCFETPQGALESEKQDNLYNNIHSVINPYDPVPKVAMSELGFAHYGSKEVLPIQESDICYDEKRNKMLEFYNALESTHVLDDTDKENPKKYVIDDFCVKKISVERMIENGILVGNQILLIENDTENNWSQARFLDMFLDVVTKDIAKTRSNYVEKYQDSIREACAMIFGSVLSNPQKMDDFSDVFWDEIAEKYPFLAYYVSIGNVPEATYVLEEAMVNAANGVGITEYNEKQMKDMAVDLLDIIYRLVILHPNYTVTLVSNIKAIGSAHYPELCYAWLCASDRNYTDQSIEWETNGDYRIMHINCPVDVEVYNSQNELIAQIVDDTPLEIPGREMLSSITFEGDKEVILPVNESYLVRMKATDEGLVNCSIQEFSLEAGENVRILNYYDMPVKAGDVLTARIDKVAKEVMEESTINGTNTEYVVFNQVNQMVVPDVELSGEAAKAAYYYVDAKADNAANGMVFGSGSKQIGAYAMLQAIAYEGCEFEGWYEKGELLSTEKEYRIRVEADREIIGVFSAPNTESGEAAKTVSSDSQAAEKTTTQPTNVMPAKNSMNQEKNETNITAKEFEEKPVQEEPTEEQSQDAEDEVLQKEQVEEKGFPIGIIIAIIIGVCMLVSAINVYIFYTGNKKNNEEN